MNSKMDKVLGRKIFSTLFMIMMSMAVMVVLCCFAPVQATTPESPFASSDAIPSEAPEENPQPTQSVDPTEGSFEPPAETASPEATDSTPEITEVPSTSPEETTTPEETGAPAPTVSSAPTTETPAPTKAPIPTPTKAPIPAVPTTPPKLELLTPPGVTAPAATSPIEEILRPEESGFEEGFLPGATFVPTPTPRVEHIEQVEIDTGFQLSDLIEILCWVAYTLAGTFLLFGLARIAILMGLKRDILPSKKEREKAKAERLRKEAEKANKVIQTDISQEDFQIHKDDWNWK